MYSQKKVVIVGPAYPLRGGIAASNNRLAKAFEEEGYEVIIYSFSLQYPSFLFPGTSQTTNEAAPFPLKIKTVINSVNPLNWIKTGKQIKKEKADLIVVRYWIPFMGASLGTILRIVGNRAPRIGLTDNVMPHEARPGDTALTRYFLGACDGFVTMSEQVAKELDHFQNSKPVATTVHPLYDHFGDQIKKETARQHVGLPIHDKIILFFGFIRQYKGLDLLLQAMADDRIRKEKIKLLIAGEFYENEEDYQKMISQLNISEDVIIRSAFIPDEEVRFYLSAADVVIQPYRNATQSGVTPLAFHFEKPTIVTNVGGLPELVKDEEVGLVTGVDPEEIATSILKFYTMGEDHFLPFLQNAKKKYAWSELVHTIESVVKSVGK